MAAHRRWRRAGHGELVIESADSSEMRVWNCYAEMGVVDRDVAVMVFVDRDGRRAFGVCTTPEQSGA